MKFLLLVLLCALPSFAGTYTAATCNYSDVNAIINGPTHTAVTGDVIVIPAGTCTWTSGIVITVAITVTGNGTPNNLPSQFGAGTLNTVIIDNYGGGAVLTATGATFGQTMTIELLDIEPESNSTALVSPVQLAGTCSGSGCPQMHLSNLAFGLSTQWTESGNGAPADWMIRADNIFGVIDHSTLPSGSQVELFNGSLSAYLGTGAYGDNSWAQTDTFGALNNIYLENNIVYSNQAMNDCDEFAAGNSTWGGCRVVGRFNEMYFQTSAFAFLTLHGTDTGGRYRGGRQLEAYGNTLNCIQAAGCASAVGFRSGSGFMFGNSLTANYPVTGGFWNTSASIVVYRRIYADSPWSACGGSGSWDTNDGTIYYTGTVTTAATLTMTDTSKTWTTNQFIPNGAPYSVYDTTQGFWAEIASNTSGTLTVQPPISESGWTGFNNGDSYQILRATICIDQGGRGIGTYISGNSPSPVTPLNQALDPIYEWDDTGQYQNHGNISSDTGVTIANRDWYSDNWNQNIGGPTAQTSATAPFNGSTTCNAGSGNYSCGVGFGTLALRPTTCTPGVGYFATDQGSWNTSGNGFGSGVLSTCGASNVWSAYYTPYTYPHPLDTSGGSTSPTVTTTAASSITTTTASAGGNVTSDGGATVTSRGTCYATSSNPTTPCTSDGAGTGTFTSSLSGLTPGTLYHIRAFATNSVGTSYGSDLTFTTTSSGSGVIINGVIGLGVSLQ